MESTVCVSPMYIILALRAKIIYKRRKSTAMKTTFGYRVHPVIENQNSHGRTHGRRKTTTTGHLRACGRLLEIDPRDQEKHKAARRSSTRSSEQCDMRTL